MRACVHAQVMLHVARVVVHAVVGLTLGLMARVVVIVFVVEFPSPFLCIWRYTLYTMKVLPKDDRINSVQEERLGLQYWTMNLAICIVVDESKCLDIPILESSIIWEHLPFLPGNKQILRPLLVHRNLAIWR